MFERRVLEMNTEANLEDLEVAIAIIERLREVEETRCNCKMSLRSWCSSYVVSITFR